MFRAVDDDDDDDVVDWANVFIFVLGHGRQNDVVVV